MSGASSKNITFLLLGILVLYFGVSAYLLFANAQYMVWDPSLCLKMTDNVIKHIPFNYYAHPAPHDLAKDEYEFVTWWTPGQFALPMFFQSIAGVKLNIALKITTLICLISTAWGTYKLFGLLITNYGTSSKNILLTLVLLTMTTPYVWGEVNVYDGGGMLLLAYAPWFIYGVVRYGSLTVLRLLCLFTAALIGFFLKASFTALIAGAVAYLFFVNSVDLDKKLKDQNWALMVKNVIWLVLVLIAYLAITKIFFLDHNRNISNTSSGIRVQPRILFFPMSAWFINLFSTGALNRTVHWIIISAMVIPLIIMVFRSKIFFTKHKIALAAFGSAYIAFYAFLYFLNIDVSYDPRHFGTLTLLLAPAIIIALLSYKPLKTVAIVLMMGLFLSNGYWFVKCFIIDKQTGYVLNGLPTSYPTRITDKLTALDTSGMNRHAIFYFNGSEPSIALAIKQNRVLLEDNFVNFHFNNNFRDRKILYHGITPGELYVTYPDQNFKQDSLKCLTKFERYKKFDKIFSADGYSIFKGIATGN